MARLQVFDTKVERVRAAFEDLRQETEHSIDLLGRIASAETAIDEAELDIENSRLAEAIRRQEAILATAADLVLRLDEATGDTAVALDGIKRFTRLEHFVAFFSMRKARRMQHTRTMKHLFSARLEELLSKSGEILHVLEGERALARREQQKAEADLVRLIERRKGTASLLDLAAAQAGDAGLFAEEALLERSTSMFRTLVESLNDRLASLQTLLAKLAVDGRQRLFLCRAVEGWGLAGVGPEVAGDVHAAGGSEQARDIQRRKARADDAVARRFGGVLEKLDTSG
ncbi:hypothetical protein [Ciceribacter azotifigens]|uniref:hypothetical protein n=1 Tax=Ciceribacter azotifigens TaxID=2069303 RepID=UPI003A85E466